MLLLWTGISPFSPRHYQSLYKVALTSETTQLISLIQRAIFHTFPNLTVSGLPIIWHAILFFLWLLLIYYPYDITLFPFDVIPPMASLLHSSYDILIYSAHSIQSSGPQTTSTHPPSSLIVVEVHEALGGVPGLPRVHELLAEVLPEGQILRAPSPLPPEEKISLVSCIYIIQT